MVQETLFGVKVEAKTEEEIKAEKKRNQLEVVDLGVELETPYATILNFECDDEKGWELQTFKEILKAQRVFNRKTKREKFQAVRIFFYKEEREPILSIDDLVDFKTEYEVKQFLYNELEHIKSLAHHNKFDIFWDTRRYFWKREKTGINDDKCWAKWIPRVIDIPSNLEKAITDKSFELKELLKKKYVMKLK